MMSVFLVYWFYCIFYIVGLAVSWIDEFPEDKQKSEYYFIFAILIIFSPIVVPFFKGMNDFDN